MTKKSEIFEYVKDTYNVDPEQIFSKFPSYYVLRHNNNRRWFGLIMNIRKDQLGLSGEEIITILNVKVQKELIGNFRKEKDIFPAYHMNKENWVSINLNSNISFLNIKKLIDTSFELTS